MKKLFFHAIKKNLPSWPWIRSLFVLKVKGKIFFLVGVWVMDFSIFWGESVKSTPIAPFREKREI